MVDKEWICTSCLNPCEIKPLDNSFDYAGTHCTGGRGGTHYPAGYGDAVSACCEDEAIDEFGNPAERRDLQEDYYA